MITIKRIISFYFINLVALYILDRIIPDEFLNLNLYSYLLFPFLFVLLGQMIGFFAFVLIDKKEVKARVFFYSAMISTGLLAIIFTSQSFFNWKHDRDFGNIKANEDHFKYYIGQHKTEEKIAFDSLSKKFTDPNSFKIIGTSTHGIDSIINGVRDTILFISLRYVKKQPGIKYKADFIVFNDQATMIFFDKLVGLAEEAMLDSLTRKGLRDIKKAMKSIRDSTHE